MLFPSRTQLEAIVALTQGAAGLIDQEGRVMYLTSSLLGYRLDTLYGRSVFEALDPEDLPVALKQFQRCIDQPGIPIHVQMRKTHTDGSKRVFEAVLLNKLVDPEIQAVVLQYRDITAVKAFEERESENQKRSSMLSEITELLAESFDSSNLLQKLARSAVDSLADFCIVYRYQDGRILRAAVAHVDPTQAATMDQIVGVEVEGTSAVILKSVIESGEPQLTDNMTPTLLQRMPAGPVKEAFRKLGATSSIVAPLIARERRMGAIAVVRGRSSQRYAADDLRFLQELARRAAIAIDNERLYRESQEATRLRDEFLATISHELRTPLTAIAGWAAVLRRMKVSPDIFRKALESIERNVKLQTSLIDDLLDGSRIVTGKMRLSLGTADLVGLIRNVIENMQVSAELKAINLVSDFKVTNAVVTCDPDRIQQIFWNLVSNAIKFTPMNGHITVTVDTTADNATQVTVSDTGVGISADFLPYVFEQFRQYDGSSTRRTAGLGLGLSIAKHLVALHGGEIRAESPGIGQGATFRVVLPANGQRGAAALD